MTQKTILCIAADGFEDLELVAAIDVLTRVGVSVVLASINSLTLHGAYGTRLQADLILESDTYKRDPAFDGVVVPGGKKNALALSQNENVLTCFREFDKQKKLVAAICAAPSHVLTAAGIVQGRRVSGDPVFNEKLAAGGAILTGQLVTVDRNMITGIGPGSALEYGLALAEYFVGKEGTASFRQKWGL